MRSLPRVLIAAACALIFAPQAGAQQTQRPPLTPAQWKEDIDLFVKNFSAPGTTFDLKLGLSSRGQVDFEKLYPAASFEPAVAGLRTHLSGRSDAAIALDLMRIVASAHVGHTSLTAAPGMGFEEWLPIGFRWFSDGVMVTSATPEYRTLTGKRLVTLGGLTPEQIETRLSKYISSETPQWLRYKLQGTMGQRPYLEALGAIDADGQVSMVLADSQGARQTIRLPLLSGGQRLTPWGTLHGAEAPLRSSQPGRNYWYRFLAPTHTAYIRYRSCAEDPAQHFSAFVHDTMKEVELEPADRVVVDLRGNHGGNSRLLKPLIESLDAHKNLRGHIFVLIDTESFSSGLMAAVDLKTKLQATLVGEPSGEKLDSYGEVKEFTLPNSRLTVRFSSKHFSAPKGFGPDALQPDIAAPMTAEAFFSAHDPALEAAESASIVRQENRAKKRF